MELSIPDKIIYMFPWPKAESSVLLQIRVSFVFPSSVSGRGYKIGPVRLCVCLSVSQRSHGWIIWHTDLKICVTIDLDNISDEFEGQGRQIEKRNFLSFWWVSLCRFTAMAYDVTRCHAVTSYDITWHHIMMSQRHNDVIVCLKVFQVRIPAKRARRGRGVNAQAFSLFCRSTERFKCYAQLNGLGNFL